MSQQMIELFAFIDRKFAQFESADTPHARNALLNHVAASFTHADERHQFVAIAIDRYIGD